MMPGKNIHELDLSELKQVLADWKEEVFRAQQIFSWMHKKGVQDFVRMSNLPLGLRQRLKENFSIFDLNLTQSLRSADGTQKFLFKLKDGNFIEAVLIPTEKRVTGCVSTQAGCKLACAFCASGLSGFKRNLSCAEIIEEVAFLKNHSLDRKLTHIVFMGVGEPLDNYNAVLKATRIINSAYSFNIAARRITISTCGIIPGVKKLAEENLQIELSISLHASDDKTRSSLMPINKKYPLKELILACREYIQKTGRQITFEYILLKGINSDLQNAQKLSKIIRGLKLGKVNLIAANSVRGLKIEPPEKKEVLLFRDYLIKQGINVTLRKPRGEDIEASCGQLRLRHENKF